jgi:hypothetical protein
MEDQENLSASAEDVVNIEDHIKEPEPPADYSDLDDTTSVALS